MRTLRKIEIDSMERELQVLKNPEKFLGGTKGDWNDPYTETEYNAMLASGSWIEGAYVAERGYVLSEVMVTGSYGSYGSFGNGSGSFGNGSFLSYYNANPSAIFTTAMERLFESIVASTSMPLGLLSTGNDLYSLGNNYTNWKNGEISEAQFYSESIRVIGNTAIGNGFSSLWTITEGGLKIFSAYMTEAAYRMRNFVNGGWMNSQYGW